MVMRHIKEFARLLFNSLISLLFFFVKIKKNKVIITSTQNTSYNFNSKYLFEYLMNIEKNALFDVYYIINDTEKRQQLNEQYGTNRFIESNTFSGILFCLDAKFWISSTFEVPINSLFRNRKRKVVHLGHGVPLKNIGLSEERISIFKKLNRLIRTRQFTDIVCYSDFFKSTMLKTFANRDANYLCFGQSRNDNLATDYSIVRDKLRKLSSSSGNAQYILYAPTWRPYGATIFFPFELNKDYFDDFLRKHNVYIFTRSHPFYPSKIDAEIRSLKNIIEFNSDVAPEICDYLTGFDGLITDYSSIYIDYLVTDHKVAFIPYDLDEYTEHVGFSHSYDEFTPGAKIFSQDDIMRFILSKDDLFRDKRQKIKEITNTKNNGNNFEIIDYLKKFIDMES